MKKKDKQEELESLITLAEEISGDIKHKTFRVNNVVFCGAVVITLLWACFFLGLVFGIKKQTCEWGNEYDKIYEIIFPLLFIIFFCYGLWLFLKKRKIVDSIRHDGLMLDEVREIIVANKEKADGEMSIVGREIINMRLKRIKFKN